MTALAGDVEDSVASGATNALALDRRTADGLAINPPPRPIVVVIGMHRSGTSLCAHILSVLGVDMADDPGVSSTNEKGQWERWEIMALQDEILALLDRRYHSANHDFPLPPGWWAEPKVREVQSRIETFLRTKMPQNGLFGFKDPRTAKLLPLWLQIFKNLNLVPRFILCVRSPGQVARSLHRRDGLDLEFGEYRTLSYLVDCFRYVVRYDVCPIEYEDWFDNSMSNVNYLLNFLDVRWDQSDADLSVLLSSIIDRELRHSEERHAVAKQPLVRSFYNLVTGLRKGTAQRSEIDRLVNQFVVFQQLLWPFERRQRELMRSAERVQALEARIAALEADLSANIATGLQRERALGESVAERSRELEAARADHRAATQRLTEGDAKLAALQAEMDVNSAAGQQRAQALSESLEQREREREAARRDLSAAEQRAAELTNVNQRLADELVALRAAHAAAAESGGEREKRRAALEAEFQAHRTASREREQALGEAVAARGREAEAARAEHRAAVDRLAENDAKLAALRAQMEVAVAGAAQPAQASSESLAERDRDREAERQTLTAAQQRAVELTRAKERLEGELTAARAEHATAAERARESEKRRAALEAELNALRTAGQAREQALNEAVTARSCEAEAARAGHRSALERLAENDATLAAVRAELEASKIGEGRREPAFLLLAHISDRGDVVVSAGDWAGGPNEPGVIEGLAVLAPKGSSPPIEIQARIPGPDGGWTDWAPAGVFAGTRGRALPLAAVRARLGESAKDGVELVAEALFRGAPAAPAVKRGRAIELAGTSETDPLVGFRFWLEPATPRTTGS